MELTAETGRRLADLIHRLCGLVLGPNKDYLIRHRLEPLLVREGLSGYEQLLERLQGRSAPRLHDAIVEAITTKETGFFRDHALFLAIQREILPACIANLRASGGRRHRIRIWSAACSTGQEPYSLAMIVRDLVDDVESGVSEGQFTILASDISSEAVETARAGIYLASEVKRGLSEDNLKRHCRRDGKHWLIADRVRRLVQFQRFDLMQPPTQLGAFDLILCRNVLIYFDEATRKRICAGMHGTLYPGGWLALGAAESLFGISDRFEQIRVGRTLLYRKSGGAA